jgi:hypothetical protein
MTADSVVVVWDRMLLEIHRRRNVHRDNVSTDNRCKHLQRICCKGLVFICPSAVDEDDKCCVFLFECLSHQMA